jgi:hypothetical protein
LTWKEGSLSWFSDTGTRPARTGIVRSNSAVNVRTIVMLSRGTVDLFDAVASCDMMWREANYRLTRSERGIMT